MRACRFFLLICFLFANSVFATITPGSLPDGTKGLTYTAVRFTSDKVSSTDPLLRWQVPGKPNNIDINRDGVYMGTPSEAGNFTLTVSVYSGARLKDTLTLIHKISETLSPTINGPYTLPDGQYDRPYAQTSGCRLRASGGTPYASNSLYPNGYRWEKVVNGQSEFVNLPRGLELSANGTILSVPTGPAPIPTSDQTYKFKAKATDKVGKFSVAEFTMVIKKSLPPRILSECPLPEGIEQMQYIAHTLSAAGGKSPYFWSTTPALPAGLVLDSGTGIISGKPTVPGNFSFQIVLRDANGLTANKSCSIKINAIPYITTSAIFDCASVGSTKCSEVEAIGGATPYTWAMVSGPPLTGYSDAFVGTPTITPTPPSNISRKANVCATFSSAGNFTVWVQVTAPGKPPTKKAFGFRVYDTLAITNQCPLAGGSMSRSYNATLTATGGKPSYTWSLVPPNTGLPPGLSLNATTGVISGTPTAAGNFSFTYRVTDACSKNATKNCTITIILFNPFDDPNGPITGNVYSMQPGHNRLYTRDELAIMDPDTSIRLSNFDMRSQPFSLGFAGRSDLTQWFQVKYDGYIRCVESASYVFRLDADDGARLRIYDTLNSQMLEINNDGLHGMQTMYSSPITLAPGIYRFELDYYQGPPTHIGLQLFWSKDGSAQTIIPPENFVTNSSSSIPSAPSMFAMAAPNLSRTSQDCVINAKSLVPNVSDKDLAKTEHLVAMAFLIGKTEVANQEYCVFLNAVAKKSDPRGLYNFAMSSALNGGILRTGNAGAYAYTVKSGMGNYPVVYVSWFDAARYVNWLSNGSPTGLQDKTTTEDGAYALNGAVSGVSIVRNAINPNTKLKPTKWLLNESEWFTSAYLKSSDSASVSFWNYPTQSDTSPDLKLANPKNLANYGNIFAGPTEAGFFSDSASAFGTFDQGGNVREWTESVDSTKYRIIRGGSWADSADAMKASESDVADPALEDDKTGFRIGGVP